MGSAAFTRAVQAYRDANPYVDEALTALENSDKWYAIVEDNSLTGSIALGGRVPLEHLPDNNQQDLVDYYAARHGITDVTLSGIALIGRARPVPAGHLAYHESLHLRGIEDRGQKYGHNESIFDLDRFVHYLIGKRFPDP